MPTRQFVFTQDILKRVSFNPQLFLRELKKAQNALLPVEIEALKEWLRQFCSNKPDLLECLHQCEFA